MTKSGRWGEEEDILLKEAVERLGAKQWRKIAEFVPGRTSIQCLHRWTKILKPGLVKGPWTPEEDEKLRQWVKKKKGAMKWADATKEIPGRSGKQIRERWFNILNPKINKAKWTEDEERLLFQLYNKFGPKWCSLVCHFENRTENSIKNRFYSTLRRVATEYKRTIDKGLKSSTKAQTTNPLSIHPVETTSVTNEAINPKLYFENPQIAKTEELLRFLPMVMTKLNVNLGLEGNLKTNSEDMKKVQKVGKTGKIKNSNRIKSKTGSKLIPENLTSLT